MKYTLIALMSISLAACVTSETTTIAPDGTKTTVKTSGPDAASVNAAVVATEIIHGK